MKHLLLTLGVAAMLTFGFAGLQSNQANAEKPKCYACGSGSKGACKKGYRCFGTRKSCRAKGCKITGYSSTCSTAANVKKCSDKESKFFSAQLPMSWL
jgi:hypothetical protein